MTSQEYILSVLRLPFSDEDKAAMIVKLVDAGIKAGVATVSDTTIAKAPAIQAQATPAPAPVVASDLLMPPVDKPPAAPPTITPPVTRPGITFHAENGRRVDDIVPSGTPGTVTLPVTGHVVSLPQTDVGELFMGYLNRVKLQLGSGAADLIARSVFVLASGLVSTQVAMGRGTGPDTWPEAADRLCNYDAYATQAQKDAAALARQQMVSGMQGVAAQQAAPPAADPPSDTVPVQFN